MADITGTKKPGKADSYDLKVQYALLRWQLAAVRRSQAEALKSRPKRR